MYVVRESAQAYPVYVITYRASKSFAVSSSSSAKGKVKVRSELAEKLGAMLASRGQPSNGDVRDMEYTEWHRASGRIPKNLIAGAILAKIRRIL